MTYDKINDFSTRHGARYVQGEVLWNVNVPQMLFPRVEGFDF